MLSVLSFGFQDWLLLGALAMLSYPPLWIVYIRTFHRFADIPGPFWASVSRAWLVRQVQHGDLEKTTRLLHRIHGPIVRIAPDEVSIASPSAIRNIYGAGKPVYHKTDFYLPLRSSISRYPDHLTNLDPAQHAARKRIVAGLYTASTALDAEPCITHV